MALNYLSLRNYVEPNVSIGSLSVSTLIGSTVTGNSSGVFPSTLTVSTLTGCTLIGSTFSGSTLSVSSLTGSALSLQTLSTTSATLTTGNLFLSTGKLGVGTDAPSAYLTVNGSITIKSLNGNYEPGCIYSDANWGMLFRGAVSTPTNSHFGWYSSDGTQLMRIGLANDFAVSTSVTSYLGNGLYTVYNDLGFTADTIAAGSFPYGGSITGPTGGVYTFTAANGSSYIILPVTLVIGVTYKVSITARSSSSTTLLMGNNIATAYYQSPALTSTLTVYTFSFVASGSTQLTVGPVPAGAGIVLEWSAFSLSKMDTTVTGSVGIGTSTPVGKLDVWGSIYSRGVYQSLGAFMKPYVYVGVVGGASFGVIGSGGTEVPSLYLTDSAYVGIGTTNPTTTLHVETSDASTVSGILSTRYYLTSAGDNQDNVGTDNLYGPWYGLGWSGIVGIAGPNYPCLAGWGGVAMRSALGYLFLADSGNVGIGTTNPNYKLKIEQGLSNNLNGIFISNTNYGSMQGLDISMVNAGVGNFYSYASIQGYTSGVAAPTPLSLQPTSGNVGIGITNPSALLYLNSSTANRLTAFYIKSSGAGIVLDSTQETGGKSYNLYTTISGDSSGAGCFRILNITNGTVPFEISATGQINVATTLAVGGNITSNGVALPITNGSVWGQNGTIIYYTAGVVGIGTASPANSYSSTIPNAKLSILNGISGQENGKSRLSIGGDNAHYSAIEGAHTTGGATTLAFMTCTNAATNSSNPLTRMFIDSSGNVGIGTTNPATSLHIARSVITSNTDLSLMTYYENTYESYHDWAIGPYIHNDAAAFAIRSGSNNLPSGLTNLFFIDGYGTAIQFPAYTTTGTMTMNSGGLITSGSSDRRIKENIIYQTNTSDALSRVLELKPATFNYISGSAIHLGFIAQDVEQFIPEAVDGKKYEWLWEMDSNGNPRFGEDGQPIYRLDKDGNRIIRPRSIDDRALIAMQTLAIQELVNRSTSQKQKIESLESQLSSLLAWAQAQGFTS